MINEELKQDICHLIRQSEDCKLKAYYDTAGIITIGIGLARKYPNGTAIKEGDSCTTQQAYNWLNYHLDENVYPSVEELQQEYNFSDKVFCALCSFAYNLGVGCLKGSSIVSALQSGDLDELAHAFLKYDKVRINGVLKSSKGLKNRRLLEIKIFNPDFKGE